MTKTIFADIPIVPPQKSSSDDVSRIHTFQAYNAHYNRKCGNNEQIIH